MRGRGTKRAQLVDKGKRQPMAAVARELENPSAELPPFVSHQHEAVSVKDLETAYEHWFGDYIDQAANRALGVYSPVGKAIMVRFDSKAEETKASSYVRGILKYFTLFPNTKVPSRRWFSSDSEALFNDWVMVGSDLYGAIQQYKIESPHVRADNGSSGTEFSSPW